MKEKRKNFWLTMTLIGLCTVALMFGLSTGSVLAQDKAAAVKLSPEEQKECDECEKKTAEKHLPPHERPAPADPSGHKHGQPGRSGHQSAGESGSVSVTEPIQLGCR